MNVNALFTGWPGSHKSPIISLSLSLSALCTYSILKNISADDVIDFGDFFLGFIFLSVPFHQFFGLLLSAEQRWRLIWTIPSNSGALTVS